MSGTNLRSTNRNIHRGRTSLGKTAKCLVNVSDTLQRKQYLFRSSSVSGFHCGFIRSWMFKCAVKKLWKQFGSGLWTNRIRDNEERRSNYRGKTKKYNNIRCTVLPAAGYSPSVSSTSQFRHIKAMYVRSLNTAHELNALRAVRFNP